MNFLQENAKADRTLQMPLKQVFFVIIHATEYKYMAFQGKKWEDRPASASETRLHSYNFPLESGLSNSQCYRLSIAHNITISKYPDL